MDKELERFDVFTMDSIERVQQRARWAATLLVLVMPAALLWLGPQVVTRGMIPVPWDKLLHLLTFALLALALGMASRLRGAWALLPAFAGAVLVGALDEWWQQYQPNRSADWLDFAANVTGAVLGCLALVMLAWLRDRLVKQAEHDDMW